MPVSTCVMAVEGVLQKHVSNAPIPVGIALYHGLCNTFNLCLVTDSSKKETEYWLALEGLNKHSAVEYNEGTISFYEKAYRRLQQVSNLRRRGYHIDIVIEPDPAISAKLLSYGFNTMTFTHASYALPEWRPDYQHKVRPWDDIINYQEETARLKAMEMLTEEEDTK